MQLGGVLSTSPIAKSFIGTGLIPKPPRIVCFSAILGMDVGFVFQIKLQDLSNMVRLSAVTQWNHNNRRLNSIQTHELLMISPIIIQIMQNSHLSKVSEHIN